MNVTTATVIPSDDDAALADRAGRKLAVWGEGTDPVPARFRRGYRRTHRDPHIGLKAPQGDPGADGARQRRGIDAAACRAHHAPGGRPLAGIADALGAAARRGPNPLPQGRRASPCPRPRRPSTTAGRPNPVAARRWTNLPPPIRSSACNSPWRSSPRCSTPMFSMRPAFAIVFCDWPTSTCMRRDGARTSMRSGYAASWRTGPTSRGTCWNEPARSWTGTFPMRS